MNRRREFILAGGVALGALSTGWVARRFMLEPGPSTAAAPADFFGLRLPDHQGHLQEARQWRGRALVINFWATWCPPCLTEIPLLVSKWAELHDAGVKLLGIALDQRASVSAFMRTKPLPYPILIGDLESVRVSEAFGNRAGGLPFTAALDRSGQIRKVKLGALSEGDLDRMLALLR